MEPTILIPILLIIVLLFLAAILLFRALVYGRVPEPVESAGLPAVEGPLVAEHLAAAIRLPTIAHEEPADVDHAAFRQMHELLAGTYPRMHAALRRETPGQHSVLYTWQGANADLEPVMLCAHLDVVPVEATALPEWTHPPFGGVIADGQVWGRGALDDKSSLITICEAIEGLIRAGFQPERTIYIAFGSDEELYGFDGAASIAQLLVERGERLAAVFDEGGAVAQDAIAGVSVPVALLGVTEKGFVSYELKVEGRPGHSMAPPPRTAIGLLARAIARVEDSPMPARMYLARRMFEHVAPFMPFSNRLVMANHWLLGGILKKKLAANPTTNAMIRTTMAATIIQAGVKDNVLPAQARAVINCRIMPGDSVESVADHIRRAINDEAVQVILPEHCWGPAPISETDGPVYDGLSRAIRQVFPECVVAPYLVGGATDSRHYRPLTHNIYRFAPYIVDSALLKTIHGNNERVGVETLARMVQFYTVLVKAWAAPAAD